MPADIVGTNMLLESPGGGHEIRFHRGPIFSNIVLADEVNRATPKTQSAFLEAMQERRVTALGETYALEAPFFVLATQNPIETEGTYPLPEAQLDRFFFKLKIEFPTLDALSRIVDLTTSVEPEPVRAVCDAEALNAMSRLVPQIEIADRVKRYALRLVRATHPDQPEAPASIQEYVTYGASPRAAQSIILGAKARAICQGRYNVSVEDIKEVALPSLRHRLILSFEGEVARMTAEDLIRDLLAEVDP
jgi:MoxR-like ATPase